MSDQLEMPESVHDSGFVLGCAGVLFCGVRFREIVILSFGDAAFAFYLRNIQGGNILPELLFDIRLDRRVGRFASCVLKALGGPCKVERFVNMFPT